MAEEVASATELLLAWGRGQADARDALVPLVQAELKQLARRYMSREREGHTLQATALVNEAYLRLVELDRVQWRDRTHFMAMAARVMRRVLVDSARARRSEKRGGAQARISLDDVVVAAPEGNVDVVALDRALEMFGAAYPRHSQVVELRYFGGMSLDETADVLGVSRDTVKRDWRFAKLWLLRAMEGAS
jgi:RNA polymerase sigma-70 factor, ECF subfamily